MIKKSDFVPIFADNYNVIFIRNNKKNQSIIKKYKIPKERFKIVKN
jgi:hypothetical protein